VEHDDTISLKDYLVVLRRQRVIVLVTVVLVVVAALAVSFMQTPIYEAESEVVVEPVRRTQDVTLEELLLPQSNVVQTERLVVTSRPVAERVVEELGLPDTTTATDRIRVEAVADTRVMRIVASHPDPNAAAETADAFAVAYLDHKRDQAVEGLLAARADLDERAESLRAEIAALDEADEVDEVERGALLTQLSQLAAQGAELGDAAGAVTGGGSVLTPAEIPDSPVSPRPLRTGALAIVLGALLGVGLAFLRDHVDDVIRDESDFKRATGDRPILGRVPRWNDPEGGDRLATVVEPSSLASEAYRELSAGVRFLLLAHGERVGLPPPGASDGDTPHRGRSIMLTSATAGDGKTSTAANLAVAAARVGLRTLLVDADLRRPSVAGRFGIGRTTGLSDLLLSGDDLRDHVVRVGIKNLVVLPAGTMPPNPTELLASPAMRALEAQVLRRVDLVIYDTPAVLAVPDALELGRHVDVAIVVGRAGVTGRREMQSALERLQQVGTDVAGSVLNDIDQMEGYYYSYYYVEQPDASEGRRPRGRGLGRRKAHERGEDDPDVPDTAEDHQAYEEAPLPGEQSAADLSRPWNAGTDEDDADGVDRADGTDDMADVSYEEERLFGGR
jgi:polysaccharide biosynthesis transport protein